MIELTAQRGIKHKVFDLGDGKKQYDFHIRPIHFDNGGVLEDIDPTLTTVNGKFHPTNVGYDLDVPVDLSKVGFIRGGLQLDFIPITANISAIESGNTGVKKLVTFNQAPVSNEVEFTLTVTNGASIFYEDASKEGARDLIRTQLSNLDAQRLDLEKNQKDYDGARAIHTQQEQLETDLFEAGLTEWDKVSEVSFNGAIKIVLGADTIYVRQPTAWDSNGDSVLVGGKLKKVGNDLVFVKVIPQSFIDNAVYPITTDAVTDYYAGSGDGYVRYITTTWAAVHSAATGDLADYTNTATGMASVWKVSASDWRIYRSFFPTDTSAIADGDTISAASFFYTYDSNIGNVDSTTYEIVQTSQASTSSLTTADYDALTFTSGGSGAFTTGTNEITLNATGLSWISKTGVTKIGGINSYDLSDTSPTGKDYMNGRYSEYTGTTSDPYLSVTTSSSLGAPSLLLLGVG